MEYAITFAAGSMYGLTTVVVGQVGRFKVAPAEQRRKYSLLWFPILWILSVLSFSSLCPREPGAEGSGVSSVLLVQ